MSQRIISGGSVTILNGATDSGAFNMKDVAFVGLIIPAAFTGASISFKVSDKSDGTFVQLYDETGTLVSVAVGASRAYALPAAISGWQYVKVVSASAEVADRVLTFVTKS